MDLTITPPAYVITETDKAGLVIVVTTFLLVSIIICLFVRLFIRLTINGPWKWDDWCVAIATVGLVSTRKEYRKAGCQSDAY